MDLPFDLQKALRKAPEQSQWALCVQQHRPPAKIQALHPSFHPLFIESNPNIIVSPPSTCVQQVRRRAPAAIIRVRLQTRTVFQTFANNYKFHLSNINPGDNLYGKTPKLSVNDYRRKISNLFDYRNPWVIDQAKLLLNEAKNNRRVSNYQYQKLEELMQNKINGH